MIDRRRFLTMAAGALALAGVPPGIRASAAGWRDGLTSSDLVYLSPLRSNGTESRCQAEIWFVAEGDSVYVVTAANAWRARALERGLDQARIWVGDLGVWTRTDSRYRGLPTYVAHADRVDERALQEAVLDWLGAKYPVSWVVWGRRFRNGLADGSRVMLRYQPLAGGT